MTMLMEPGELRWPTREQTGDRLNQDRKGRLTKLTARLAQRQAPLHQTITLLTGGAMRVPARPGCWSYPPPAHPETPTATPSPAPGVWPTDRRRPSVHESARSRYTTGHTTPATPRPWGAPSPSDTTAGVLSAPTPHTPKATVNFFFSDCRLSAMWCSVASSGLPAECSHTGHTI